MTKDKSELMGSLKREKKRNYVILYTVTLAVWLLLVAYSFLKGFFNGGEFVVNVVNNIIGILPPILIFDFFNEKLTKESDTIEMSNQITETLMSNPETLELFSEEQKKNFIRSAVCSVVRDPDAADMLNDTLSHYLSGKVIGKIRTSFDYDFVLEERLPAVYETLLEKQENYFYVQEKLCYTVKYLTEQENNAASNLIKIGFTFDNKDLDNVLRERKTNDDFENCIFRESLDLKKEDLEKVRRRQRIWKCSRSCLRWICRLTGLRAELRMSGFLRRGLSAPSGQNSTRMHRNTPSGLSSICRNAGDPPWRLHWLTRFAHRESQSATRRM